MGNIKLILGGILIAALVYFVWSYVHTIEKNKSLENALKAEKGTIELLDKKVLTEQEITKDSETILKEVRNAPLSEDAPVAPVLDLAIDRIDRMHNATNN